MPTLGLYAAFVRDIEGLGNEAFGDDGGTFGEPF
jgi:hypothetical protein